MQFNNRENRCYKTEDGDVWHSRSVAVVGLVLMIHEGEKYVLLGKRGPALPNEVGKYCLPCGYLDWDESCEEAVVREIWEETGLNIYKTMQQYNVVYDHMHFPWMIHSEPDNVAQNVSMHYAICFDTKSNVYRDFPALPELTFENNAEVGEVDDVRWIKVDDLSAYECAFGHERTIRVFVNNLQIDEND